MNTIRTLILFPALVLLLMLGAACSLFLPTSPTPTAVPEPIQIIAEPTVSGETIVRHYAWRYGNRDWSITLAIPQSLYDYYAGRPRPPTQDYSIYVTHPLDDQYISVLVDNLRGAAADAGLNEWETVNMAVSFVQSMPYTEDSVTTPYDEYPRYPIETLVDYGGDCEDTSILMAAILREMGYGVVLLLLPNHMAVGVLGGEGVSGAYFSYNEVKYYYLETTGEGWKIGMLPPEYEGASAGIYAIEPTPILTHNWTATTSRGNKLDLNVTVENLGTAAATGVYIYAAFDAGDNMVWNPAESPPFNLAPDQMITISMQLNEPKGEHTRLIVQIVHGGYSVDKSYSEWFDT